MVEEEIVNEEIKDESADSPKEESLIEKAESVAKRMEDANVRAEENTKRMEEIAANKIIAGRSERVIEEPKVETTDEDYSKAFLEGTLDPFKNPRKL